MCLNCIKNSLIIPSSLKYRVICFSRTLWTRKSIFNYFMKTESMCFKGWLKTLFVTFSKGYHVEECESR
ncbi:hypothetical protein CR513_34981, partial [Mucuna pruriens]